MQYKKKKKASTRVRSRTRKMHTEDLPTMAAAQAKAFSRLSLNSEAGNHYNSNPSKDHSN